MDQYITAAGIAAKCSISRSTVWRWVKDGVLPRPIKLTARTTVWRESDVQEAINRIEAKALAA